MTRPKVQPFVDRNANMDWCHLCGRRSTPHVSVASVENAEHPTVKGKGVFLRACVDCLQTMVDVMNEDREPQQLRLIK